MCFDGDKKKFVQKHIKILNLIEEMNHLYKPIIFWQIFSTSLLLCFIGFPLVMIKDETVLTTIAVFGLSGLLQLFLLTLGGQLISDATAAVTNGFYDLDKDLIIMTAMANKHSVIQAGFYEVNLSTFLFVINATASNITILKSLSK